MLKVVTFRMNEADLKFLDEIARSMDRDRSYLINQAVENFLEVKRYHMEAVESAVADADDGKIASSVEVEAFFRTNREQR